MLDSLLHVVYEHSDPTKHELYIDNFFTSHKLLLSLKNSRIKATGTIQEEQIWRSW